MYPHTDLTFASHIIAARIRHAELQRDMRVARANRLRFRLSLPGAFGRRKVAGAVR